MGVNLVVFRWKPALANAAGRRKANVSISDVVASIVDGGTHAATAALAANAFLTAVAEAIGKPGPDGPYLLTKHARALVFDIAMSAVPARVAQIGRLAQKHGLVAVES